MIHLWILFQKATVTSAVCWLMVWLLQDWWWPVPLLFVLSGVAHSLHMLLLGATMLYFWISRDKSI